MTEHPLHLIVGLGNPGGEYRSTRHNVGFRLIERLAGEHGGDFRPAPRLQAQEARIRLGGAPVVLACPQTFMNLSGEAVVRLLQNHRLQKRHLLVVHDDLDLAFGRLRVQSDRGDGGHKGVRSIIETLKTRSFARVRMGIGRPPRGGDPVAFVLEPFGAEEEGALSEFLGRAAQAAESFIEHGLARTMTVFNRS